MNRRGIPAYGLSEFGPSPLREQGFVILPFRVSINQHPQRRHPHYHDFFQVFLLHGKAVLMHDFRETPVEGITLMFLLPGQVHAVLADHGVGGTTVSFTQDFFDHRVPPPSRLFEFPFFASTGEHPCLPVPEDQQQTMVDMFAEMQREFDRSEAGAADMLRWMLRIIFVRASRIHGKTHSVAGLTRGAQLARQFQRTVEERFRELQSVAEYAQLLGVSTNHLHDTVQEQTGKAAGEIIRERRLLDAKRLLCYSDLSVSEIGYQLRFTDSSYFGRFFRRHTGLPPAIFRDQFREKHQPKAD
ncbi:MAG TPA: AraC family transcriptional regulator [Candidatus Limnocylindria bacterium]|nr:AraC family transcriptional regulator [Candidatus Limnocylindria bacterium]